MRLGFETESTATKFAIEQQARCQTHDHQGTKLLPVHWSQHNPKMRLRNEF